MSNQPKAPTWAGWIIAALIAPLLCFSAAMKFLQPPEIVEQVVGKFGYTQQVMTAIGVVEVACLVVYLVPRTAVLGAVLMTGYLGGAVATHVRVEDNFLSPIIVGAFVWLGLYLRDPRLRALLPIRRQPTPAAPPD